MGEHIDIIVVGAGLSGIDAAYRIQTELPSKSYAIFESREAIGGTWDLFRYPGIRSDSDMFTLGFPFRPWKAAKSIADGASILEYVRDTAAEFGIDQHIRFRHKVTAASWSSEERRWSVHVTVTRDSGETYEKDYTTSFLYFCSGYYSYTQGHMPQFPNVESFEGQVIQPQFWPKDLDYTGKKVVVIGSGATAVTLLPSMAPKCEHITMLQRSPSYFASLPAVDPIARWTRRFLPEGLAHTLIRIKNALMALLLFQFCKRFPEVAKRVLGKAIVKQLPAGFKFDPHFVPSYNPWDQRMCLVPDGDFFKAIRSGKASIVTDRIDTFTKTGIRVSSGDHIEADIVIAATGLNLQILGGASISVDGKPVDLSQRFVYKGLMLDDIPNMALCIGYTNASWTLRADLSSLYVCRFLKHMIANKYTKAVPRCNHSEVEPRPLLNLNSGYIQRATSTLPRQGSADPWYLRNNYVFDWFSMKFGGLTDKIEFS
eukprot:TRINITY_DN3235_c0_g1_i1.p1 TRINITY_DN3235_c0_g1~~TRINITY_DN3235_c0_g1_i1.p1  ORF type:complete len:510 (+),score=116.87 TRINITY_DN3235_c0_g1_i1:78-1532(+)